MKELFIKKANNDIRKELETIKFDASFLEKAVRKYEGGAFKLYNVRTPGANILKQSCLSLGFDCAVSRDTVTCREEYTDCIIFASRDKINKLSEKLKGQPFGLERVSELLAGLTDNKPKPLELNSRVFDWSKPYIMGILNVTPDSFSDGGKYNAPEAALKHCEKMLEEGADIIDIGGESTRPGADIVSVDEEIRRVIPVIEKIRNNNLNIPLSVDTRNFETAKASIDAGADIINDVSGLSDKKMFDYVVSKNISTVVMHSDKVPAVSQNFTTSDIVEDVYLSLCEKVKKLEAAGMDRTRIIIDPGFGFGKSPVGCFEMLKRFDEFTGLNLPLLAGISRKSFIRNGFNADFDEADVITATYSAMLKNSNIHRVHNVKLTADFLKYAEKLCNFGGK